MATATPSTRPPFVPTPSAPTRAEGETLDQYAARLLCHLIHHPSAVYALDRAGLETADRAAAACVTGLPTDLQEAGQTRYAATLADLRHTIARERERRRLQLQQLARLLADATDTDDAPPAPGAPAGPPESETERAARLLRAGLIALMGPEPPQDGGGGRRAPLVPPSNPKPTDTRRRF